MRNRLYANKYYKHFITAKISIGAREMAQPVRAFAALAKGQVSAPYMVGRSHLPLQFQGIRCPSDLCGHQGQMRCPSHYSGKALA